MEIHDLLAKVLGLYISSETVWGSESIFYPIAMWTSADEVEVSSTWGLKDSQTHHESLWQASKQKHTNVIWRECSFWRCSSWLNLPKSLVRQKLLISCANHWNKTKNAGNGYKSRLKQWPLANLKTSMFSLCFLFFRKDVSYIETLSVKVENLRNLCKTM